MRHLGPGDRRGFTLVELLVALVVGGVVIAAAHGALAFAIDSWARARAARAESMTGAGARAALLGWVRAAALLDGGGPFRGVVRGAGAYPRSEIRFAVHDGGALHPGPRRIHLWVDADPGTARSGLLAELSPLHPRGRPDTLELAPSALGMSARFLGERDGRRVWLTEWESDERLPLAVEIRLLAPPLHPARGGLPPLLVPPVLTRLANGPS